MPEGDLEVQASGLIHPSHVGKRQVLIVLSQKTKRTFAPDADSEGADGVVLPGSKKQFLKIKHKGEKNVSH